jgi:CLIP-associating protein 1/2
VRSQVASDKSTGPATLEQELDELISELDNGDADVAALKRLALICQETTSSDLSSPPLSPDGRHPSSPTPLVPSLSTNQLYSNIWEKNKTFERFFKALMTYLDPERVCSNTLKLTCIHYHFIG